MEVSYLVAFGSGVVSFFAPCVLPLLPAYFAYMSGESWKELSGDKGEHNRRIWWLGWWYVVGFSVIFVILGSSAAALSKILRVQKDTMEQIGGLIIVAMAIEILWGGRLPGGGREFRLKIPKVVEKWGYVRAVVLGMVFATAWTPCVGPILGSILTLAAAGASVAKGASLLLVYSLGISLPFMLMMVTLAKSQKKLKSMARVSQKLMGITGLMLLGFGFLMWNNSVDVGGWGITWNGLNAKIYEAAYGWGWQPSDLLQ